MLLTVYRNGKCVECCVPTQNIDEVPNAMSAAPWFEPDGINLKNRLLGIMMLQ
jgi:hypothetical protein